MKIGRLRTAQVQAFGWRTISIPEYKYMAPSESRNAHSTLSFLKVVMILS